MGKAGKTEKEKLDELLTPAEVTLGLEAPSWWADAQDSEAPEYKLGERIKSIREKLGLTHDGLSELTKVVDKAGRGISRTTIRGYELRTYKPGAREIRILSLALKVSPSFLIFGNEDLDTPSADQPATSGKQRKRWARAVFPAICYSQLGEAEKQQVTGIIEALHRLQIGEVKFRSMKAFIEDFTDTVQDAISDQLERKDVSTAAIRQVLLDTAREMRARHGDVEGTLLESILPLIESWSEKAS